jgi:hypothetical protein
VKSTATNFSNIAFVLPLILALNGCATFFSDFVNYGFSDPNMKATFEFFGGTGVEAEVQALPDEPPIVLGNGISESGKVMIPDGPFIIPIGNPFVIGELEGQSGLSLALGMRISELSGILRYDIDSDENDNDVEQLLTEIVTGQSGAFFEYETRPGISGVSLIDMTSRSFTLAFEDYPAEDTLTFAGEGVEAILQRLDSPANITDKENSFSMVDMGTEAIVIGNGSERASWCRDNDPISGEDELGRLLQALLRAEDDSLSGFRVELVSIHSQSIALFIFNDERGSMDLVLFHNPSKPGLFYSLIPEATPR